MRIEQDVGQVELRRASAGDADFVYSLVETTMRGYVEQTWNRWDEQGVRKFFREAMSRGSLQIVCECDVSIGALAVERHPTHLQLEELFLLPSHQNRGIGSHLVRRVIGEAKTERLPVRLRVLAVNPAVSFYKRLGFLVAAQTPERFLMEHHA